MDKNLSVQQTPLVTVMMPVHNGERYIKFAIESILSQTYKNFELLIINDASNDQTVKIVRSFKDPRMRLIHNSKQLGLSSARQRGVSEAKGSFIAFLDSDDTAHTKRLELQIDYLQKNPKIALVGSWVELIDENGKIIGLIWKHATDCRLIPSLLFFRNCFTQSAVTLRKSCLNSLGFRQKYFLAPDYDLWKRLSKKFNLVNLGLVLTYYRYYRESMSFKIRNELKKTTISIHREAIKNFGLNPTQTQLDIHDFLERLHLKQSTKLLGEVENWLMELYQKNNQIDYYDKNKFALIISQYWFKTCCYCASLGLIVLNRFSSSQLSGYSSKIKLKKLLLLLLATFKKSKIIDITSDDWLKMMG